MDFNGSLDALKRQIATGKDGRDKTRILLEGVTGQLRTAIDSGDENAVPDLRSALAAHTDQLCDACAEQVGERQRAD